jgi:hypothetical protein
MPDPIKKSTSYDPSTGETTFKASWNGISRGKIAPKGTQRTVAARQAVKNVPSRPSTTTKETSGERKAVAFKSPTPAKAVGMDLKAKADIKERSPQSIRKEKIKVKAEMEDKALLQNNPGMSLSEIKRKQEKEKEKSIRRSNRSVKDGGGFFSNEKQRSPSCRNC